MEKNISIMDNNFNNFVNSTYMYIYIPISLLYFYIYNMIDIYNIIDNKIKFNKYSIKNVKLFLNQIFLYKKISNQV